MKVPLYIRLKPFRKHNLNNSRKKSFDIRERDGLQMTTAPIFFH